MPHYEFFCNACRESFSKIFSFQHDAERTVCPHCCRQEAEQSWSSFSVLTSKKSA